MAEIEIDAGEIAIEDLLDHGFHARDVRELMLAGFDTCNMIQSKECLSGIKAISDAKAEDIWKTCAKLVMEDVEKKKVLQTKIEGLKLQLETLATDCGKKGAVLILEDGGTEIELVLAFPSHAKVRFANLSFKTEEPSEKDFEDFICDKVEKAKWELAFKRHVEFEKGRVKNMTSFELADVAELVHGLFVEMEKELKAREA